MNKKINVYKDWLCLMTDRDSNIVDFQVLLISREGKITIPLLKESFNTIYEASSAIKKFLDKDFDFEFIKAAKENETVNMKQNEKVWWN